MLKTAEKQIKNHESLDDKHLFYKSLRVFGCFSLNNVLMLSILSQLEFGSSETNSFTYYTLRRYNTYFCRIIAYERWTKKWYKNVRRHQERK